MATLYVLTGDDLGKSYEVGEGGILGRGTDVDFRLRGTGVSRHHARLFLEGECWMLQDLGSRNGIKIDGRKHERAELENGAIFVVGDVELRFRSGAPKASGPRVVELSSPEPEPERIELEDEEEGEGETQLASAPSGAARRPVPAPALEPHGAPESDFGDEIELEGDWDEQAVPRAALRPPSAAPEGAPAAGSAASRLAASRSVGAAEEGARERQQRSQAAAAARAKALGAGARGERETTSGRRILQYSVHGEGEGGLLKGELAQHPLWVRALVGLLLLAVMAAMGYGAFKLTQKTRANRARPALELDGES